MIKKRTLHQLLSSLWKNDELEGKTYYNQALQDVQTAIDLHLDDLASKDLDAVVDMYMDINKHMALRLDWRRCNATFTPEQLLNFAKYVAQWQSNKALEWLKLNLQDYAGEDSCRNSVPFDKDVFEAFRKAMED